MRGFGGLACLLFASAQGCQLGGDLLLHPHGFVLLVGGAEEMERHLGLQRQGRAARLASRQHFGAIRVVRRRDGQAAPHQGFLGQGQVGGAGGAGDAGGDEELPVEAARQRSHLEGEEGREM